MKLEMMQNKKTVIANAGMHPCAFTNACKLTEKLGGKACIEDARFKATFKTVKVAEQFVTEWIAQYEQAQADKANKPRKTNGNPEHEREMTAQEEYNFCYDLWQKNGCPADPKVLASLTALAEKAKAEYEANKGKKPTSGKGTRGKHTRKPTPAKGDSKVIDFNAFKGTKSEKNRALHAELVSRGLKDSRSDEYQAIWQARPWAKA
jgi:hypothetical protein